MGARDPGTGPKRSVDDGRNAEIRPRIRTVWNDVYRPSAWKSCFVSVPNISMMALDWHESLKLRRALAVATIEAYSILVRGADGGQRLTIAIHHHNHTPGAFHHKALFRQEEIGRAHV